MMNRITQDELDQHAAMWAVRPYVGEVRKPVLSPESDIQTNYTVTRAEALKWDVPGITVILVESVGIDASHHGYAQKVWTVMNVDETGRADEPGPIYFNPQTFVIQSSGAKSDNPETMEQATAEWLSRAFGI